MHQLIRLVVTAGSHEEANGIANGQFHQNGGLEQYYDYGTTMDNPDARWNDNMPEIVQETGAIRANTGEGVDMIEDAWDSTARELNRDLEVIRTAFEQGASNKEILEQLQVETEVDEWNPLGLARDEDELSDTYTSDVRYAMNCVGSYGGGTYYLYRGDYAETIRRPSEYDRLIEDIKAEDDYPDEELKMYVVPVDCHY